MLLISRSVRFAKHAKKMMIVQSIQCHVEADYTGRMVIKMTWKCTVSVDMAASRGDMWQGDWAYRRVTWIGTGDQSGSDMCHPCTGDRWHICTDDVSGPSNPYG
jgi:hypothetical protein